MATARTVLAALIDGHAQLLWREQHLLDSDTDVAAGVRTSLICSLSGHLTEARSVKQQFIRLCPELEYCRTSRKHCAVDTRMGLNNKKHLTEPVLIVKPSL